MIIFLNIAQMEFQTINLSFLLCMLIAKLSLFIIVSLLTVAISYPSNCAYAGALSILATQSNDFALGYPLIKSLYGETKPGMLNYLSLMAPIQLLILNPLGIIMLEFEKSKKKTVTRGYSECRYCSNVEAPSDAKSNSSSNKSINTTTSKSILTNERPTTNAQYTNNDFVDSEGNIIGCMYPRNRRAGNRGINNSITRTSSHDEKSESLGSQTSIMGGGRSRNIKSLTLIMPAVVMDCGSVESIATLGCSESDHEGRLVDFGPERTDYSIPPYSCRNSNQSPSSLYNSSRIMSINSRVYPPNIACTCNQVSNGSLPSWAFLKALATNPLIIASVVALAVNLVHGPELPRLVTKVSNTIAASFAAPALFVVGVSMYGKFQLILRSPNDLLLSSVLVITKVILLPSLMRTIAIVILPQYVSQTEVPYLTDFAYLYGLLPTAPTACIIATQYGVLKDVVSISMLLSTFISAPLMLGTSAIINQSASEQASVAVQDVISETLKTSSGLTMVLSLLTLYIIYKKSKRLSYNYSNAIPAIICWPLDKIRTDSTHLFTFLLVLAQLVIGIGGIMWIFIDTSKLELTVSGKEDLIISEATESWTRGINGNDFSMNLQFKPDQAGPFQRVHGLLMSSNPSKVGLKALCTVQYVLSSTGILIARFILLSIVVATFYKTIKGKKAAHRASLLMMRAFIFIAIGLVLFLVIESKHIRCSPSEGSLPTWTVSLYFRLVYNSIILLLAIVLFSITIRLENKAAWHRSVELSSNVAGNRQRASRLARSRYVTSCASLSSDTSSAMTTNTNLESAMPSVTQASGSLGSNQNISSPVYAGRNSSSVVLDCDNLDNNFRKRGNEARANTNSRIVNMMTSPTISSGDDRVEDYDRNDKQLQQHNLHNQQQRQPHDQYEFDSNNIGAPPSRHNRAAGSTPDGAKEFNKYKILIVLMLIQVMMNLTSIVQMINQERPFGTFKQIEIIEVALDFGQGLLTFLVLGMTFLTNMISLRLLQR